MRLTGVAQLYEPSTYAIGQCDVCSKLEHDVYTVPFMDEVVASQVSKQIGA